MRTIHTTVYHFDELPTEQAKERARDWLRALSFSDSSDWEFVYEDAKRVGKLLGLEIDDRPFTTMGGATGREPCIFFSGFSSQGDGACFEGRWKWRPGMLKAVQDYAPQDAELHRIAGVLQDLQLGLPLLAADISERETLTCWTKQRGYYMHSGCMDVSCQWSGDDTDPPELLDDVCDTVTTQMRAFADWIYDQLEKEYDYQTSDEQIEESIRANEYEFTEDGRRA